MVWRQFGARVHCLTLQTAMPGRWPSGQWQQTVNLSTKVYGGSNPSLPIFFQPMRMHERALPELFAHCNEKPKAPRLFKSKTGWRASGVKGRVSFEVHRVFFTVKVLADGADEHGALRRDLLRGGVFLQALPEF